MFALMITSLFAVMASASPTPPGNGWQIVGKTNDFLRLSYRVMLPQRHVDDLREFVMRASTPGSPDYGKLLTRKEVQDFVAPSMFLTKYVTDVLNDENVETIVDQGDVLVVTDQVSNINKMFNVTMYDFMHKVTKARATRSDRDYTTPKKLVGSIEFIDGVSNKLLQPLQPVKSKDSPTSDQGYVGREVAASLYGFSSFDATGTSIASIEFQGGGYDEIYVNQTQKDNGLTPTGVNYSYGPNPGGGVETMLDVQVQATMAKNASLGYMNFGGWILEFATYLHSLDDVPSVVSLSYGWAEWDQCMIVSCTNETSSQYINRANNELLKLAARRVTVVVASGDAGSPGRTSEGCDGNFTLNPVYPGSSPYVLSVGATYLAANNKTKSFKTPLCEQNQCATGDYHVPVMHDAVGWTTGAGFGIYSSEGRPSWQDDAVKEYINSGVYLPNRSTWNDQGRGYPDVTANGHNCPVLDAMGAGSYSDVDGTSCSAPLVASMIAILNAHQLRKGRSTLGFVNPLLYAAAGKGTGFGPVAWGNTSSTEYSDCPRGDGFVSPAKKTLWNPVSGLGTLNITELIAFLDTVECAMLS